MSETTPDDTQLIDFRNNGTVTLYLGARRYQLRRPKVGEFRVLRESYLQMLDDMGELADDDLRRSRVIDERMTELVARRTGAEGDPLSDEEEAEFRKLRGEQRQMLRDQQDRNSDERFRWLRQVFDALAHQSPPLPEEDDDLEPWMSSSEFQGNLVKHWMSVPLGRGR